jgi:protein ImuB
MRIACLLVPDLPLHAELRASPNLRGLPLVITSGPGARSEIIALSQEAAKYSIHTGQTLPQARAVCPEIEARIASPILERTAREALLDVALSLAPRAELADRASGLFASEGAVYLDASGIAALHGEPRKAEASYGEQSGENTFASVLHARAERAGIHGFVALAASRGIARLAARHLALGSLDPESCVQEAPNTLVLPPKRELDFLAPLPIDLLDPDDRTAASLTRFGLYRIHDLLSLPRRDLAARLGPELLTLVARARGEEDEPPLPEPRTTTLEEGQDLEVAIGNLEPLAFVLRGLISRLLERLSMRALGCVELRLLLQLEDGAKQGRKIGIASPTQDERVLLRLVRLALEKDPPTAPVDSVTIFCEGVPLRREQLDLFLPRGPSPSDLDQTLAELGSICGPERIGAPSLVDNHRPDAFALKPFRKRKVSPKITGARPGRSAHPRLTIRALRPPLRAEVRLERGHPVYLRSAVSQGEILKVAGPWRTTGHWWSEPAHFAVDHFDVQMSDGTVLRLCFDWMGKRWHIDGLYD